MANKKMTQQEIEDWEKGYAKDLPVIGDFLYRKVKCRHYRLYFKDGTQLIAALMGSCDGDNGLELNDPYYEDFYEFDFRVKKIEKQGAELEYKENEWITLNYHNFFIKFEPYEGDI
jgi:hypothetical protein